jgi:hypothetical protein
MAKLYGIPGTGHISKAVAPPSAAVGYFGKSGTTDWEPALLWLGLAVVTLNVIRIGRVPTGPEAVTWLGLSAGVVIAGAIVPEIVAVLLVGLLISGALGLSPQIASAIGTVNNRVSSLGKAS